LVALLGLLSIAAGSWRSYPDITLLVLGLVVGIHLVLIGSVWVGLATTEQFSEGGRVLHRRLPSDPGWSGAWSVQMPAC
jgi:hypothetical protein